MPFFDAMEAQNLMNLSISPIIPVFSVRQKVRDKEAVSIETLRLEPGTYLVMKAR